MYAVSLYLKQSLIIESTALKKLDTKLKWHQCNIHRVHFNGQQLALGGCLAVGWLSCFCQCPKEPSWRAPKGGHLTLCAVYVPTRPKDGCWKVSYSAKYQPTSMQGVAWMSARRLWLSLWKYTTSYCYWAAAKPVPHLSQLFKNLPWIFFFYWQLLYFLIFLRIVGNINCLN